jgi:hypothetical protein
MEVYREKGGNLTVKTFFNTKKEINQQISEFENMLDLSLSRGNAISQRTMGQTPLFSTSETYSGASHLSTTPPMMLTINEGKGIANISSHQIFSEENLRL